MFYFDREQKKILESATSTCTVCSSTTIVINMGGVCSASAAWFRAGRRREVPGKWRRHSAGDMTAQISLWTTNLFSVFTRWPPVPPAFVGGFCFHVGRHIKKGSNILEAARMNEAKRYFYASTACVYNEDLQLDPSNPGLKEGDAWPAKPQASKQSGGRGCGREHSAPA